ncbi:FHA domain-containing protein [Verrucomicrobiaceae bacterium R5-34]|uniref:FHA domain-containing protein n=1 Tax=Oceaniferula flava TaxID=2800421 RepID=A0AAE2SA44_9BACT|nr:FHA domain-containing protein [Oceaniferula flavus]MBK1831540.1 FHA domain-containing protein [Verrucomicrobiaceae bacterium R5-34]MBK1854221.1 FHA domain-containing protein [Oceaniferula flavus]MBM1135527.1 FHA domain-containing protein [Oceaniferula flavus]
MPKINISQPHKDAQAYRFDMKRMRVMIGRSSENDITIEHRSVSKGHCFIDRLKGGFVLRDNGSTNGIKLNGKREEVITLTNGMVVEIGDVPMAFTLTEEECDQLTAERFKARPEPVAAA